MDGSSLEPTPPQDRYRGASDEDTRATIPGTGLVIWEREVCEKSAMLTGFGCWGYTTVYNDVKATHQASWSLESTVGLIQELLSETSVTMHLDIKAFQYRAWIFSLTEILRFPSLTAQTAQSEVTSRFPSIYPKSG